MNKRFFYLLVRHNDTFHRASLIRACDHNDPAATLSRNEFRAAYLFATSPFCAILAMDERGPSSSSLPPSPFFAFFSPFHTAKRKHQRCALAMGSNSICTFKSKLKLMLVKQPFSTFPISQHASTG